MPGAPEMGNRNLREMKTLAWAIDELIRGHVVQAADVLVQRLLAIENATTVGDFQTLFQKAQDQNSYLNNEIELLKRDLGGGLAQSQSCWWRAPDEAAG